MNEGKRFEEWIDVDCNTCERWWTNQCDGVQKGSTKPCNSFLATRNVVIPEQIKSLHKRIDWLLVSVLILYLLNLISIIWRVI